MSPAAPPVEARANLASKTKQGLRFNRVELGVAVILSLLAVCLHAVFRLHAGALWRDEANSVQLATLPTFAETWKYLQFDSFPILFFTVLRTCGALFSPGNDAAFRTLGLLIGLAVFAALWFNARRFGIRWPVLSLALLGCNPLFIRYADSMRAYGLGILLMLLTFGAVWRVIEKLTPSRVLAAMVVAVLSVQTLYYNSVLLLAICVGGAAASSLARQWVKGAWILAIGAPAAASLLIYTKTIHQLGEWNFLVHYPATPSWLWTRVSEVTGAPDASGVWIWTGLVLGGAVLGAWLTSGRRRAEPADSAVTFATVTLVTGTLAYLAFLMVLQYCTQPWYYIAYLALAAGCLDVIFGRAAAAFPTNRPWPRWALTGFAAAFAASAFFPAAAELLARQTNVDVAAARISRLAVPGDLILQLHWENSISFSRYYHGPVELTSAPPLADHRIHRYDLILQQLQQTDPMLPALQQMRETLKSGHRVWAVGELLAIPQGKLPRRVPPIQKGADGKWHLRGPYYASWATMATYFLQQHTTTGQSFNPLVSGRVVQYEDVELSAFSGWKETPDPVAAPLPTPAS